MSAEWDEARPPVGYVEDTQVGVGKLAEALAKAQGEFDPIRRERTVTVTMKSGGKYTFSYAPLEVILRATLPALASNGLAISQAVVDDGVETTLYHSSGQRLSNRVKIFAGEGPQAYGSALTYARRYGVTLLLCVCADDDDDANAAEGNSVQVQKEATERTEIPVEVARQHAVKMLGIISAPAKDGDHDEKQKCLEALDYHEKHLIGGDKRHLYEAIYKQMEVPKRNIWKNLVEKGTALQKNERLVEAAGRKF